MQRLLITPHNANNFILVMPLPPSLVPAGSLLHSQSTTERVPCVQLLQYSKLMVGYTSEPFCQFRVNNSASKCNISIIYLLLMNTSHILIFSIHNCFYHTIIIVYVLQSTVFGTGITVRLRQIRYLTIQTTGFSHWMSYYLLHTGSQ